MERAVREAKSLPISKFPRVGLTDSAQGELERRLLQRGLERHGNSIRVPIDVQLRALLQMGAHVPLIGITKVIKGALKVEVERVVSRLVRAKQACIVVRGQREMVVSADAHVLSSTELARLRKVAEELAGIFKAMERAGEMRTVFRDDVASLLRDDLAALLDGFQHRKPDRVAAVAQSATFVAPRELVELALRRLEDPKLKIVRIPDLVRSLDGKLSVAEVHHALSEAADGGAIELQPDAGSEFLPTEDAELCPIGPRDTVFSCARLLSP
ncbi:hypothetical protein BE04_43600 [Sorangium cellulosum]|uniref:Uncharacterized protein n=1 Tax=Sorangium cellulosum TaxID=56 RepID=A0A150PTG3_SORCE|nr:hypothetical protein BE04_43600 [Sorangium cellulosum]